MAKKKTTATKPEIIDDDDSVRNLRLAMSSKPQFRRFKIWLVGDTPLITHAWSEKAKREMLQKQIKATKAGKEARDPEADFVSSLYKMGNGAYGFPATGVKNCILSAAHKDKGVPKTAVMSALWINAEMVRVMPAKAGAICDMPLIRIYGSEPENREDMVKIGSGLNKTANLTYRGQFTHWAMLVTGRYNPTVLTDQAIAFLFEEAGMSYGLGEWRNEKKGMFGAYHMGTEEEERAWENYAFNNGPLPVPEGYRIAAE